jgi:hypothetical protein
VSVKPCVAMMIGCLVMSGGVFADGGDTCAAATPIAALPFADSGTTTGKTDDISALPSGCPMTSVPGEDVIYTYTITGSNSMTFTVTPAAGFDPIIYILGTCGNTGVSCHAVNAGGAGVAESVTIGQVLGAHAFYIDSVNGSDGTYDLSVTGTLPVELLDFAVE